MPKINKIKKIITNLASNLNISANFSSQPYQFDCGSALQINFSLVDDNNDFLLLMNRFLNRYDIQEIDPIESLIIKIISGDTSDNIGSVWSQMKNGKKRGIGEKGAALIARHYATAEDAIAGALAGHEHLTASLRKKIIEGQEYLSFAPKLVACATDVPLPKIDLSIPKRPKSMDPIHELQEKYGLGASVDRLISALNW